MLDPWIIKQIEDEEKRREERKREQKRPRIELPINETPDNPNPRDRDEAPSGRIIINYDNPTNSENNDSDRGVTEIKIFGKSDK